MIDWEFLPSEGEREGNTVRMEGTATRLIDWAFRVVRALLVWRAWRALRRSTVSTYHMYLEEEVT